LDPDGQDVLGVNSPLKEFQAGTFETTYLDNDFRISRTTTAAGSQLRVYVKSAEPVQPEDLADEEYFDEFDKFGSEDEDEEDVTAEFDDFGSEGEGGGGDDDSASLNNDGSVDYGAPSD